MQKIVLSPSEDLCNVRRDSSHFHTQGGAMIACILHQEALHADDSR
jgi:hypothetical protein